jgi:hypothetical protein
MTIDTMKREMKEMGFKDEDTTTTLSIIRFIGMAQDVAWREGGGVLRSDIPISKNLLKYLKQGYIVEDLSKYKKYPIYLLSTEGENVFRIIMDSHKKDINQIISNFKTGNKIFCLYNTDNVYQIKEENNNLFLNSKYGERLKKVITESKKKMEEFLKEYNLIIKVTNFNSNRTVERKHYHYPQAIIEEIIEQISDFQSKFGDEILELNNRYNYYKILLESVDDPEQRKMEITSSHLNDLKEIIENLSERNITTSFDDSSAYLFKIYPDKESKFKSELEIIKQDYIDKVTDPIIDYLLNEDIDEVTDPIIDLTEDSTNNENEAFDLLSKFEKRFRKFIIGNLKKGHGDEWWENGVKEDIKCKCNDRLNIDKQKRNQTTYIQNYMDFNDLYSLIEWKQNKKHFDGIFPKDLSILKTKLNELYDIRNPTMHSRREITDDEISKIKIYIKEIESWINDPRKEEKVETQLDFLLKSEPVSKIVEPLPRIKPEKTKELESILVGFECGTGTRVDIEPAHLFISGVTQKAGKTTTLEALIYRSGFKAVTFVTKPNEKCFESGRQHLPFFKEDIQWKTLEGLFQSLLGGEKTTSLRARIIKLCKNEKTLTAVKAKIDEELDKEKVKHEDQFILIQAYIEDVFNQLKCIDYTTELILKEGINIMDLQNVGSELQSYIINSVLKDILYNHRNTIVIIPEAWKFIPQSSGSACKKSIEELIRQGANNNNFLWFDSQDIANVDKKILKNVFLWILGLQTEKNEAVHTIKQIPLPKKMRPTEDIIMTLEIGEFFVCKGSNVKKTYVMPRWMEETDAYETAKNKTVFET